MTDFIARLAANPDAVLHDQPSLKPEEEPPPDTTNGARSGSERPVPQGIDGADLLALVLPPLRMVIPDLLPEGTTILAAPPKVGKSCLVYQMAVEVALGGDLFGRAVEPGSVLYLALEDGNRRGQARLKAALEGRPLPRGRLEVRWSAPRIGEGLEDDISRWLDVHADAGLIAVDTLGRVRPRTSGHRGAYEVDVEDLARLQELFRNRPVALVIVHHSRKQSSDDFLTTVSGTYGITGSADTILVVKRARLDEYGVVDVTGRDIPEAEIPVRFDGWLWHPAPEGLAAGSFEQRQVYDVIRDHGPIFPAAIAERLGKTRLAVHHVVMGLVAKGAVARAEGGYVATEGSVGTYSTYSDDEEEGPTRTYSTYSGETESKSGASPDTLLGRDDEEEAVT